MTRESEDGETLLARFVGSQPTRDLDDWHRLLSDDLGLPIESHRGGLLGRTIVAFKRLLRPLVKAPQQDLWDRQRVFDLVVIEELRKLADLRHEFDGANQRLRVLETCFEEGLRELARANDALYSRVDLKLERALAASRRLQNDLRVAAAEPSASSHSESEPGAGDSRQLSTALGDVGYLEFENRFRGDESTIRQRVEVYVDELVDHQPVLDLGCGRGELLSLLARRGVEARGVDANAAMVRHCREDLGLDVRLGDLNQALSQAPAGELGAVVCLHVVEHLPRNVLHELLERSYAALGSGGLLLIETPNPRSLVAGASHFWRDASHLRPVHPDHLREACRQIGFTDVGYRACHPFSEQERLPEVNPPETSAADEIDRMTARLYRDLAGLRDAVDDLLYGDQDYVLRATKP